MDTHCSYRDNRGEILIAYLYNDIDSGSREMFERHLPTCDACRRELEGLRGVRTQLEQWAPPEPAGWRVSSSSLADRPPQAGRVLGGAFGAEERDGRSGWRTALRELPAWAQVAAAVLFVGIAASIANLRVEYNEAGVTVRTGWLTPAAVPEAVPAPDTDPTPWRVELAALQEQLRGEMRAAGSAAAANPSRVDADRLLPRVRALIEESEQRQQRELALRIAEVDTSVRAQRIADLRNIDRNLNVIQSNTGVDMRRLYEMTNSLAVRVSQPR